MKELMSESPLSAVGLNSPCPSGVTEGATKPRRGLHFQIKGVASSKCMNFFRPKALACQMGLMITSPHLNPRAAGTHVGADTALLEEWRAPFKGLPRRRHFKSRPKASKGSYRANEL